MQYTMQRMIHFRKQISNTGINTELSSSVDGDGAQLRRLCTLSVLRAATGCLLSEARVDGGSLSHENSAGSEGGEILQEPCYPRITEI